MLIRLFILSLFLVGCLKLDKAPKSNSSKTKTVINNDGINCDRQHRISKGDTLFSLAWKCETSVKRLAQINDMKAPYLLRIGQIVTLRDNSNKYKKVRKTKNCDRQHKWKIDGLEPEHFPPPPPEVGGQAVLGRQLLVTTPWLTERHGYDPTYIVS